MKQVLVLGASGSLGSQVVDYLNKKNGYVIKGIGGWHNTTLIEKMAELYNCKFSHKTAIINTHDLIASQNWDIIVNCVSGNDGIELSWFSCRNTKQLIIGNKETLFISGKSFLNYFSEKIKIIPLDSELTSLWYLKNVCKLQSEEILITASGGALHKETNLENISLEQILVHPIWNMGTQITIDSSSMINKIFELYSASVLFQVPIAKIKGLICRTSEIHAGIINSNKIKALDYKPSMTEAIKLAFEKENSNVRIQEITNLQLESIDINTYPIYGIKSIIFSSQKNRTQLLNLSVNLGREIILKQISFFEMVKKITIFYKNKS